jgi:hypothetical protein
MIAAQLSEMTSREIDRKGIQIPAPIRTTGEYKIPARFVEGVIATVFVEVIADSASIEMNKQMAEEAAKMTEEDTNVLDPSFEDVLAAAEAKIDETGSETSQESEDSTDESEEKSEE